MLVLTARFIMTCRYHFVTAKLDHLHGDELNAFISSVNDGKVFHDVKYHIMTDNLTVSMGTGFIPFPGL